MTSERSERWENEILFISVWKSLPHKREGKPKRESPKIIIFISVGFGPLQMILEKDIGQCASKEVEPQRKVDLVGSYIHWRKKRVQARTLCPSFSKYFHMFVYTKYRKEFVHVGWTIPKSAHHGPMIFISQLSTLLQGCFSMDLLVMKDPNGLNIERQSIQPFISNTWRYAFFL